MWRRATGFIRLLQTPDQRRSNSAFGSPLHSALGLSPEEIFCDRRILGNRCESACGVTVAANALVDTGALLALLDRSDHWHRACVESFEQLRLPLMTSEAVLTELFHLVGDSIHEVEAAWRLVRSGAIALATIEQSELPAIHALMLRYSDRPMDFADATLVYLAKREKLTTMFTVDHADFDTYRIEGRRRFRVIPASQP